MCGQVLRLLPRQHVDLGGRFEIVSHDRHGGPALRADFSDAVGASAWGFEGFPTREARVMRFVGG